MGGALNPSEIVVCTFTNRALATLSFVKRGVNDDGGSTTLNDFGITTSAGTMLWDAGTVSGDSTTYTGSVYDISASQTPFMFSENDVAGYTKGHLVCDGNYAGPFDAVLVVLGPGDNVTCDIITDDIAVTVPALVPVNNLMTLVLASLFTLGIGIIGMGRFV